MKRFIAISILSIYLISSTELHQLLKLPMLIEHYSHHQNENKNLGFWEFLCLHYADHDANHADHDEESKLPFKSDDGCVMMVSLAFVSNPFSSIMLKPEFTEQQSTNIHTQEFLSSSFLSSIWQPPKTC